MIIPAQNPVAFTLFQFPVYWYGIIMALALFAGTVLGNCLFNKINPELKKDLVISYAPVLIISGILGARLYFCMLNPEYYFSHPLEILDIREGGLSIHGALIFGIISLVIMCLKDKISPLRVLDILACSAFLGQAVGRWGNYFNSEAYGMPVAGQNWGLFIPVSQRSADFVSFTLYHPAFLYESVLDLAGLGILLLLLKRFGKRIPGVVFFVYLMLYALIRFGVEQIRIDSALNIGVIPVAQVVSVLMFLFGLAGLFVCLRKH